VTEITKYDSRLTDTIAKTYERSERLFSNHGLWYFKTREGKDVGPFRYRDEAELMLTRFVSELHNKQQEALAVIKPHFRVSALLGKRAP
jgi:ABC-type ATPase with predicted acetyltransferase domain